MEEIDLKELIAMFLERKFLIIAIVLVSAVLGVLYTKKLIIPEYQSSTSLVLVQVNDIDSDAVTSITSADLTLNTKLVDDYREIAQSRSVAERVIENLNLDMELSKLQSSIAVSSISDTELIRITVTHTDPELACTIANEVAKAFIEKVDNIYKVSNVHVLDEASPSYIPSNIHLTKNVAIFAFAGLILVSSYILLINMLDTTIKADTDIERVLKVPVLASIVLSDETAKKKAKSSTLTNSYDPSLQSSYQNANLFTTLQKDSERISNLNRNKSKRSRGGRI